MKEINRTPVIIVAIVALAAVVIVYVWCSQNRYYAVSTGSSYIYLVDRKTGTTWLTMGTSKRRVTEQK